MIRAIRPNAMAQDDAALVAGWNIAPNLAYVLRIFPGSASCGVLLYDNVGTTLIASGAALVGTALPCVLAPQSGQTIEMVDADLGWHLLLTTTGTEAQRDIRIGPAVDLPDEIHPVYGEDDLALVRATAAIDAAAHYIDDITVTCPLGLGAGLGGVVSVPVDGVAVIGQVESITWTATPDWTPEQSVIRRHVAIAPEAFVEIVPPTVADDTGTATHNAAASGNVLTNDDTGLVVVAVDGLSANVGEAIAGDNGGLFTIESDGAWTFDPNDDFDLLEGSETADTSVTYHASDGTSEVMATLTVTVSYQNTAPVAVDDEAETPANQITSGNVLTNDSDIDGDPLTVAKVAGSAENVGGAVAGTSGGLFTIAGNGTWSFDPDGDFASLTGSETATTSIGYHVSDGQDEDEGTLTVTVTAAVPNGISLVGSATVAGASTVYGTLNLPPLQAGDLILVFAGATCSSCTADIQMQTSGYTMLFYQHHAPMYQACLEVYFKIADGSETQISLRGVTNSYYDWTAVAQVWRGVDQATPFDVAHAIATQTSVQPDSPSITPATTKAMVITAANCATSNANSNAVAPSGYGNMAWITQCRNTYAGNTTVVASKEWSGSGAEDPPAWSGIQLRTLAAVVSATLALRPAA